MASIRDITGMRFGHLTVIQRMPSNSQGRSMWLYRCDCGKESMTQGKLLKNGHTKSCGCQRGNRETKYGARAKQIPEYAVWMNMKERCRNPNKAAYKYYGARGIIFCERWESFENFLADMGPRPSPQHVLDRIEVNGNYEPTNCRWLSKEKSAGNRRPFGRRHQDQWLMQHGLAPQAAWLRLE